MAPKFYLNLFGESAIAAEEQRVIRAAVRSVADAGAIDRQSSTYFDARWRSRTTRDGKVVGASSTVGLFKAARPALFGPDPKRMAEATRRRLRGGRRPCGRRPRWRSGLHRQRTVEQLGGPRSPRRGPPRVKFTGRRLRGVDRRLELLILRSLMKVTQICLRDRRRPHWTSSRR